MGKVQLGHPWNSEVVYFSGDAYFDALIQCIDQAKHSVRIESYIFELDQVGNRVLHHLKLASERGIQVQLMVDGVGCLNWGIDQVKKVEKTGIQLKVFRPAPWQVHQVTSRFISFLGVVLNRSSFFKMNLRNHRKVAIFDSKTAFVGGMNISADSSESIRGMKAWKDCMVQVSGWQVERLEFAFLAEWSNHRKKRKSFLRKTEIFLAARVRLNSSWRLRRIYQSAWLQGISQADSKVWIVTPYFAPSYRLWKEMIRAHRRGVDLQIVLPKVPDVFIMDIINGIRLRKLLKLGIPVFHYLPSTLHAKVIHFGTYANIGSSNWTRRSFFRNLEIDVVVDQPETLNSIEKEFQYLAKNSERLDLMKWNGRAWIRKMLESILKKMVKWV